MMRPAVLALLLLALAAPAHAATEERSSGSVTANLTTTKQGVRLAILRAGEMVYDERLYFEDCGGGHCPPPTTLDRSLWVRDLDGDAEPEVTVSLYSGGAHCCVVAQVYDWVAPGYDVSEHWFGDAPFRIRGTRFHSMDARFAYAFTAYAFSRFPVMVREYAGGAWTDVTQAHLDLVRRDARAQRREARRLRREGYPVKGAVAAYVADRARLGAKADALAWAARYTGRPRFVAKLERLLGRWGY